MSDETKGFGDAALRLCTHEGCVAYHYENCPKCFGFGLYEDGSPVGATDATAPATGVALNAHLAVLLRPCPHCGSTSKGAPTHAR